MYLNVIMAKINWFIYRLNIYYYYFVLLEIWQSYSFDNGKWTETRKDLHGVSHFGHIIGKDEKYVAIFGGRNGYIQTIDS